MTAISVKGFRGQVPRFSDRLIGPAQATIARNCKITSGRLDPIKGPLLVHTSLGQDLQTIYRYVHEDTENWLVWDRVVDVVLSTTVQDSLGRFFYTGDGEPRMSTFAAAISGGGPYPNQFFVLGVAPPVTAPSLAVVGGSGGTESRSYAYTFKTQFFEESAPSLPVTATGFANGSWNLSAMEAALPNSGTISAASTVATGIVEVTLDSVRGLFADEEVVFAGVVGMTDLNGTFALLSVDSVNSKVRISLDTPQTYSAGADTWARVAPHNLTGMTKVIYRSVGTNEKFFRVAEVPVANTTYNDVIPGSDLEEELPTADTFTPPKNLHSIRALPNGCLAGLAGNELCFSEISKPSSWPIAYRYAFAGEGVTCFAAGNSVIVLTKDKPIVATATTPEQVSMADLPTYAPCVGKRTACDVGGGCLFASHDGLYLAAPSGVKNVTDLLFRYDEWQVMKPDSFKAAFFDQRYYAMHDAQEGDTPRVMVLDMAEPDCIVEIDTEVDNLYANPLDGKFYILRDDKIYEWDADDANRFTIFWSSRVYQEGKPINFACAQVHARYAEIVPPNTDILDANIALMADADNVNGALAAAPVNTYAINGSAIVPVPLTAERRVQFTLLKDGAPVFTKDLVSSEPFRLPAGYKTEIHGFQLASSVSIYTTSIAQSMQELAEVSV